MTDPVSTDSESVCGLEKGRKIVSNESQKTLLINLISSGPNNVGKAMRMGRNFVAAGWSVNLFLSVDGVGVLDPKLSQELCPVAGKPLSVLL